jgi:hypothetical protein
MAGHSKLIAITGLAGLAVSSGALGQSNNNCSGAIPVPLQGSVEGAILPIFTTNDGSATCGSSGAAPDVWHSVTVTCGGTLTLYTCPASFDTVISAHTGCPGTVSNQIACNDDSGYCGTAYPLASMVNFEVQPGTYLVRVAGYNGATGSYTLNAAYAPAGPANYDCAHATPIGIGSYNGWTGCAAPNGSAACGSSNSSPAVWYRYTAPCDGVLSAGTCPASFDTVISVHEDCPGTSGNQLACNDDSPYCGTAYPLTSYVSAPVQAGQDYMIRVSGFNGASGTFTLNTFYINPPGAPGNDACASAFPLVLGANPGGTSCATLDGSTSCGGGSNGADVWYRYVPTSSGTLSLYTCPASYDTLLSVHTGCPGTQSNEIACNDDSGYCGTAYPLTSYLTVPVVAGIPYMVRVAGFGLHTGTFTLNAALAASSCYPNCDGSTQPPILNVQDFTCFLQRYAAAENYANCDSSTVVPTLNVQDFTCFLQRYAAGCQ